MLHKEKMPGRIASDTKDRENIRHRHEMCNSEEHPEGIVNIVSGRIAPKTANVDIAVTVGKEEMKLFEAGWPEGFYKPLSNKVVTMSITERNISNKDQHLVLILTSSTQGSWVL